MLTKHGRHLNPFKTERKAATSLFFFLLEDETSQAWKRGKTRESMD
jgi:hypothetical protein